MAKGGHRSTDLQSDHDETKHDSDTHRRHLKVHLRSQHPEEDGVGMIIPGFAAGATEAYEG